MPNALRTVRTPVGLADVAAARRRVECVAPHVQRWQAGAPAPSHPPFRRYARATNSSMSVLTSGGFSSAARCATPSSTATPRRGSQSAIAIVSATGNVASSAPATTSTGVRHPRQQRTLIRAGRHHAANRPAARADVDALAPCRARYATTSGRVVNVVGPRNALSTERVSGGRIPPINPAMRSSNPYSSLLPRARGRCRAVHQDTRYRRDRGRWRRTSRRSCRPTSFRRSAPLDAEAVEDVDDAPRAIVESKWRRERFALAVTRRVDQDHPVLGRRSDRPAPPTCRRSSAGWARTTSPRRRSRRPVPAACRVRCRRVRSARIRR